MCLLADVRSKSYSEDSVRDVSISLEHTHIRGTHNIHAHVSDATTQLFRPLIMAGISDSTENNQTRCA